MFQRWSVTASDDRDRKKRGIKDVMKKRDSVRDEMRPCSVPLACVSAHWQSSQLFYTSLEHPVCYFGQFLNNLLSGNQLVWLGRLETIHLQCHGFECSSYSACPSIRVQVTSFVSQPILKASKAFVFHRVKRLKVYSYAISSVRSYVAYSRHNCALR